MYYIQQSKLRILIDPLSVHTEASDQLIHNQVALSTVFNYLKGITDNKVEVKIIFPKFLWDQGWRENFYSYIPSDDADLFGGKGIIEYIEQKKSAPDWAKKRVEDVKKHLESKKEGYLKFDKVTATPDGLQKLLESMKNGSLFLFRDADYLYNKDYLSLIDLYFTHDVDFLLTSNRVLHAEKSKLSSDYRLFVVDYPEIFEKVETFLKGHHIYISHANPIYGLQPDVFYPMTDSKLQGYQIAMGKIIELKKDQKAYLYFRGMFYHRYSFIRYAIDQIKFNMFQAERLEDIKLRANHYFLASYHLNNFYLNLWGFIDNLAWVINHLYDLGFNIEKTSTKVSFLNKDFLKQLKAKNINLHDYLKSKESKDWLTELSDKRHPAAHREPLYMSALYNQDDMSLISENLIVVNTKKGQGIFEAVKHLNYDFEQLLKFTDKVLKNLTEE